MRTLASIFLLLLTPLCCQAEEWLSLFNGKDLTGWQGNVPDSFVVEDGAIRTDCQDRKSCHLFYVGELKDGAVKFKNFELEATVRCKANSNSGIFVHTDMSPRDSIGRLTKGYEVQLNNSTRDPKKTGSLYDVVDFEKSPVDETNWFKIQIVVRDKRITVAVDGKQLVDYTEPDDVKRAPDRVGRRIMAEGGAIALQAHDKSSVWYFKDIRVKRLP